MATVIIFLVVLIVLVVAHEAGHFFVAKSTGVKVEEFGIGYPPRALKLFTWKGTLFTLNWLPFGGFVKIFGENIDPVEGVPAETTEKEKTTEGSFVHQKMWKRLSIIAAGIVANIVLAIILYSISFSIGFLGAPGDFPGSIALSQNEAVITEVLAKSPASAAGIKSGDIITSLSAGQAIDTPATVNEAVAFIKGHGGGPIAFTLARGHATVIVRAIPEANLADGAPGVGITLMDGAKLRMPFFRALGMGFTYTFQQFASIIATLGALIAGIFSGHNALLSDVSGPVGIARIAGSAYALGLGSFLAFVALISVNLAVVNLLPFPALDGGRFILELFSSGGKSKIPTRAVNLVNQIGFLILLALMLFVTYHDIVKLVV